MVHLIPLQLWTFIVLIPERQRTAAFKEQPKSSESCVVAQKRCGIRLIKSLLRITTKRWPHRTYREQDKKVAKQSFFLSGEYERLCLWMKHFLTSDILGNGVWSGHRSFLFWHRAGLWPHPILLHRKGGSDKAWTATWSYLWWVGWTKIRINC